MNVYLVPYRREFLERFVAWRMQDATRRYNPLRPMDVAQIATMLDGETHDLSLPAPSYRWFVEVDGEVVGSVSIKEVNRMMRFAEVGYGFDEAVHGRGIGTAAVRLVVDQVLAETDLRKLLAYVHIENVASWRLLERIGFHREGLLREHFLIDGQPVDEAFYGLLRSDLSETPRT